MNWVEEIIERIKVGEVHLIYCEPLASLHQNLAYCPYRDECEDLEKYIDEHICEPDELYNLVSGLCCGFCSKDDWLVVYTTQGAIACVSVAPELGEKLNDALSKLDERRQSGVQNEERVE